MKPFNEPAVARGIIKPRVERSVTLGAMMQKSFKAIHDCKEEPMNQRQILRNVAVPILAIFISIIGVARVSMNTRAESAASRTVAELAWMSGGWETVPDGKTQIEEHWMAPAGGSMIGMGRTVAGGRTVEFEYLKIEQRADEIYYVASPEGVCPGTDFKLTSLTGKEATFENPEHDFPKRITYRKNSDGSLTASIDGGAGTRSMVFAYRPIAR